MADDDTTNELTTDQDADDNLEGSESEGDESSEVRAGDDALVDEGKLINFGMLGHGWGDEWNLNYFMTAKNQDELIKAFGKGFSEAIKAMGPEKWKKMKGMIMEHKDNLYDVRHYHDKK